MGWLGSLGKIGASFIPGGRAVIDGLEMGSQLLGGLSKGRAEGKIADADAGLSFDRNRLGARNIAQNAEMDKARILNDRAGIDLQQRKYGDDSRSQYVRQALMGSLLQGGGPQMAERPAGVPTMNFGMSPGSLFGQGGKDAGGELTRQAMLDLMGGRPEFNKLPDPTVMPELGMTPLPQSGVLDKILGIAGPVMGGMSILNKFGPGVGTPDVQGDVDSVAARLAKASAQQQPAVTARRF